MNCVGIDVSKGKSTIAVMRPFGEVVVSPFEVCHTVNELSELARQLKSLDGETRVVMESTGNYHAPVAWLLHDAGFYVSVVNAMLVHDYGNNSLRRAKTDKKDAVKLANYGLDHWLTLPRYVPEEDTRLMLKTCYRQYQQYSKVQTMLKNNLISLLDTAFPNANRLFTSPPRADGSEKWVDFVATFWHCECVCGLSEKAFTAKYQKWCKKHGYNFSEDKALDIYASAFAHFGVMPKTDTAKLLVEQAISQLRATSAALAALKQKMQSLAASLPEYPVVMEMFGVGPTLGPQLMAEIGDVRRFHSKKALVAFAGIDAPPYQSGQIDVRSRSISKRGSASLRRTLFLVMGVLLQCAPMDEPVYQFMDKKRSEGKPYSDEDIDTVTSSYLDPQSTKNNIALQGKITNALLPVAARYNNNLDQQQRYEFRRQIRSFVKWYNYITQIVRMFDKDLHKEYIFCSYLSRLLPSNETEMWDLGSKVALEYYKLEETFAGSISLQKDVSGQYEAPTMKKGVSKQDSKSQLDEVIEKFNEQYAGEITEGDRIIVEILMNKMSQDDVLRKSAQQDGEQIFINSVFSKAYDRTAMDAYKESSQAFGILFSDPKKYAALKHVLAEMMYNQFCQQ